MRRALVIAAAAVALLAGACGGGSDKKTASVGVTASGNLNTNTAGKIAAAAVTSVCGSREAVNMGAAYSSASQQTGVNYNTIAEGLRRAADAAPSDIKDDYAVLVEAEIPFFTVLAKANGNYMSAAQDPAFQAAAQKMSAANVQQAAKNIGDWFTAHCS
jgi:hypothetical protein